LVYVVRNLDASNLRIMKYLADGARMSFFLFEVDNQTDNFVGSEGAAILVPRVAFVPSCI
jgi:hypothetical protein